MWGFNISQLIEKENDIYIPRIFHKEYQWFNEEFLLCEGNTGKGNNVEKKKHKNQCGNLY